MIRIILSVLVLAIFSPLASGQERAQRVGFAEVDITPTLDKKKPVYMAGFGKNRVATGVHDGRGPALAAEYAHQQDYADNPLEFSHAYWLVEPAYTWHDTTLRAGIEHLGGSGRHALQTPLATLHPFNGWADKFANATPPGGLEDRYASLVAKAGVGSPQLGRHSRVGHGEAPDVQLVDDRVAVRVAGAGAWADRRSV